MDSNIFSGLDGLGLSGLGDLKLFEDDKKEAEAAKIKEMTPEEHEAEMLLDKTHECPICSASFKNRALRAGKARLISSDIDLRPRFEYIEPLKYDVISCPRCGYTTLTRFYKPLTPVQRKNVLEKIANNYKPQTEPEGNYTFEYALGRYKLALVCDVVKLARASEKGYTCLRAYWLCKSWKEDLEQKGEKDEAKLAQIDAMIKEFRQNAFDGFVAAREKESYPMCGMDESTVDYLVAVLAMELGKFDVTSKMLAGIFGSASASPRMKDRARDLKEEVLKRIKATQK